jgi:hypothetical protein
VQSNQHEAKTSPLRRRWELLCMVWPTLLRLLLVSVCAAIGGWIGWEYMPGPALMAASYFGTLSEMAAIVATEGLDS